MKAAGCMAGRGVCLAAAEWRSALSERALCVAVPLPPRRARMALQAARRSVEELAAQLADASAAVAAAEEAAAAGEGGNADAAGDAMAA